MRVSEIFFSLQGEGTRRGRPCAFVRLTGCPLRCRWCDTAWAFHGGETLTQDEILGRLERYPTRLVCVTGGEPLAQAETPSFLSRLAEAGYTVLLETSGSLDVSGIDRRVVRILDLKAPGSGECARNRWSNLDALRADDEIKIVCADRRDYEWAREQMRIHDLARRCAAVLLSAAHGELDPKRLAVWILEDGLDATLQLQEHRLLWPDAERGV